MRHSESSLARTVAVRKEPSSRSAVSPNSKPQPAIALMNVPLACISTTPANKIAMLFARDCSSKLQLGGDG